ncbi:MAG: UDP-N-acetylmuramoyl-L-alanyl-D-glutamate--2,6-diaminopimelate ligase [Balneolaceae bacterium]|nr:MAG: UDP-N-acetylmuramoyl-L-alanyl-D-glutamate--2,6-diaminopimelate ligase [Balneolaceae bacterium]
MMKTADLLHIIHPLQQAGSHEGPLGRLRLDSRSVRKNDVFVALRGTASDGHLFIRDAIKKGARVVICEHIPEDLISDDLLFLQVADTRAIIGDLAQAFARHPARSMKMVGVTGTNGKTTVCTLVYQVLRKLGYNAGLLGTVETRIGDRVTESLLTTPDAVSLAEMLEQMAAIDTAFAVMEVSSHALEQQRVGGIRFDVAAFTNISQDHLDYHRDMASYIYAKKRLFTMLDDKAVAVVNRDDPASFRITEGCRADIWEFSFREDRDFRILDEGPDGLVLDLDGAIVSTPLTGRYNAYNVAQAYLICLALGCAKNNVAAALGESPGAPGRLERVFPQAAAVSRGKVADTPRGNAAGTSRGESAGTEARAPHEDPAVHTSAPKVFVDYAHTPDALENVLQALAAVRGEGDTLHVVFGCGGDRDQSKRPKMGRIADKYADVITLTSDNPRTEDPDAIIRDIRKGVVRSDKIFVEANRRKAIRSAILEGDTRTMVLVAGKGHERYQEVHGRRLKFDDRQIAGKALTEWIERRIHKKGRRAEKHAAEQSTNRKEVT